MIQGFSQVSELSKSDSKEYYLPYLDLNFLRHSLSVFRSSYMPIFSHFHPLGFTVLRTFAKLELVVAFHILDLPDD